MLMRELAAAQAAQATTNDAGNASKLTSSATDKASRRLLADLAASPGTFPVDGLPHLSAPRVVNSGFP